jgi:glyoxylase-like metal-dependent hydrolase (beta-lactamase superfamily II)
VQGTDATRALKDGDTIDLGGRVLDVLHTPSHTRDSICLHDRQTGVLFGGDTINTGPVYAQSVDSDVPAFYESCARLAELAGSFSQVAVAHFGRTVMDTDFIVEHADGFAAVLDGSARWQVGRDYTKYVAEAVFDRFSIFVELKSPYVRWDREYVFNSSMHAVRRSMHDHLDV